MSYRQLGQSASIQRLASAGHACWACPGRSATPGHAGAIRITSRKNEDMGCLAPARRVASGFVLLLSQVNGLSVKARTPESCVRLESPPPLRLGTTIEAPGMIRSSKDVGAPDELCSAVLLDGRDLLTAGHCVGEGASVN